MSVWDRISWNVADVVAFGPGYLLRHLPRVTGAETAVVHISGIGSIHLRVGESDAASVRQVFGGRGYAIDSFPVLRARLNLRYHAILESGRKPVIVDAGANIGAATLWFRKMYPNAAIIAVEPDPGNISILKRNLDGRSDITVFDAAIGSRPGFVELKRERARGMRTQTNRSEKGVPITTMNDCFAKAHNGTPFIVKVDIEGFESDLFADNIEWINDIYMAIIEPHDWMLPGRMTSRSFQLAMAQHDFEIFISKDNLIYIRV